jgi:hypothetical protein
MIQIINNGYKTFDLFNDECNSRITNESYLFLVVKNGEDGYYDAYGTFFLGNPIIAPI